MNHASKRLMIAGLLSCIGFAASAQNTLPAESAPGSAPATAQPQAAAPGPGKHRGPEAHRGMHRPDPARMAEFRAKRQAELKNKLKITASQEAAWTRFTEAGKPPAPGATPAARPSREEFAKLTTPQRIERMQQMKAERDARMAQRIEATQTLYAALTPEQQKVFDTETLRGPGFHGRGGPRGEHGGPGRPAPAPKG